MAEPIDETSDTWAILDEAFPTLREQDLGYVVQDYTVKSPNSTGRIAKKRLFVTVVAEAPADLATAQALRAALGHDVLHRAVHLQVDSFSASRVSRVALALVLSVLGVLGGVGTGVLDPDWSLLGTLLALAVMKCY